MRVLGVDPGFAKLGLAVVDDFAATLLDCAVVVTQKEKPARAQVRVSLDDSRRLGELCAAINGMLDEHHVGALAVEVFTVIPGKMGRGGSAMKTGMAYGALYAIAQARGLIWLPLVPTDMKRELCGRVSASKTDVQHVVEQRIGGARSALAALAKNNREHAADAMAAALVGVAELERLAGVLGVDPPPGALGARCATFPPDGTPKDYPEALRTGLLFALVRRSGESGISTAALSRALLWLQHSKYAANWLDDSSLEDFERVRDADPLLADGAADSQATKLLDALEHEKAITRDAKGLVRLRAGGSIPHWLPQIPTLAKLAIKMREALERAERGVGSKPVVEEDR